MSHLKCPHFFLCSVGRVSAASAMLFDGSMAARAFDLDGGKLDNGKGKGNYNHKAWGHGGGWPGLKGRKGRGHSVSTSREAGRPPLA